MKKKQKNFPLQNQYNGIMQKEMFIIAPFYKDGNVGHPVESRENYSEALKLFYEMNRDPKRHSDFVLTGPIPVTPVSQPTASLQL